MSVTLDLQQKEFLSHFDKWLVAYLADGQKNNFCAPVLADSQKYSLCSGGKRFRPFLAYLVFRMFSPDFFKIRQLCLALEMIHTYSLIHDDLPCMDNDDFRRGQPTNHKAFSEDVALLAGDGLLTDAFFLLASASDIDSDTRVRIIAAVSEKTGSYGMVAGQVFDMKASSDIRFEELQKIHTLKTANLIQVAAATAAMAAGASDSELHNISMFAFHLGMSFQIQDDILDFNDKEQDFKSYVNVIGAAETAARLIDHSLLARDFLSRLSPRHSDTLVELVEFNQKRTS